MNPIFGRRPALKYTYSDVSLLIFISSIGRYISRFVLKLRISWAGLCYLNLDSLLTNAAHLDHVEAYLGANAKDNSEPSAI